jgi:hypothetical protein
MNMRNHFPRIWLVCCCLIAVALVSFGKPAVTAQETCGGIEGRATSPQGWLIPKAMIRLVNKATKQATNVEADNNGDYTVCLLSGTYDVLANAMGYKRAKRKSIKVDATSKVMIDFVMKQDGTVIVDRLHP